MKLSDDEARALAFIAGLIALSILGRWVDRPRVIVPAGAEVPIAELEARSEAALSSGRREPRVNAGSGSGKGRGESTGRGRGTAAGERERGDSVIPLNTATAAELERLPRVGAALAERIVAYRDSVGGFRAIEELDSVRGVGPAMLARLKPLLRLR